MQDFPSQLFAGPVYIQQVRDFTPQLISQPPTFRLSDGTVYYGEVDRSTGLPQGRGIALFKIVTISTTGNVNNTNSNNILQTPSPSSSSFSAFSAPMELPWNCKKNLLEGFRVYRNGDRYVGWWSNGRFDGEGVLITSSFSYQGSWKEGHMHGNALIQYERSYVDYYPNDDNDRGFDLGVSTLLLRGLSYLSPFEDITIKPKEYLGEMQKFRLRHGYGTMRYYNGDVYEGNWMNNRRHGQGKLLKADGETYDGMWERDEWHGYGIIQYIDGSCFKGMLEHNLRSGEGVMIFTKGDEYYGNFSKNRIDGHGTMRFKNGDVYVGNWRNGIRYGEGKYTLKRKGVIVRGNFNKGLIEGNGTVEHPGVSLFVGVFERGERIKGTSFWNYPSELTGNEKESKNDDPTQLSLSEEAVGRVLSASSSALHLQPPAPPSTLTNISIGKKCYQGEWVGENMHGKGLLWYCNGDFYHGFFNKNKRHGPGNIRYAESGCEFSGNFVEDTRQGLGIEKSMNGLVKAGWWENDEFVEGYHGEWNGSEFHGVGRLRLAVETFLYPDCRKAYLKKSPSASCQTTEMRVMMDFFGIFQNGLRNGAGILRLPFISSRLENCSTSARGERRSDLYGPYGGGDDLTADARLNVSKKSATRPMAGILSRQHVIKAEWVNDVLEADHGVWAFPSGELYCGPFSKGFREGLEGRLWMPDGSVYVGQWREDIPCGEGLFYAKNTSNPIYTRLDSNPNPNTICGANNNPNSSCTNSVNDPNGSDSNIRDLVFDLWGASPSAKDAAVDENKKIEGTQPTEQEPLKRVLVDYRDDYVLIGRWKKRMLSIETYKELVVPQLSDPAGMKRAAVLGDSTISQVIIRRYDGLGKGKSAAEASQIASIKTPGSIPVGEHEGLNVVFYTSGVCVQSFFIANYPMLVTPHIPGSAFDHYLQQLDRDKLLSKNLSVPSHTSSFTASLRAVMEEGRRQKNDSAPDMKAYNGKNKGTIKPSEPVEDNSWEKSFAMEANIVGMGINTPSAQHLFMRSVREHQNQTNNPSASLDCCTFCKKVYNFFRSPKPCTLCMRSGCTSCLLPMESTSSRKPNIDALISRSLVLQQRVLQHSKNQPPNTDANPKAYRDGSAQGITSVPVCADCSRVVALGLQTTILWIPRQIIDSVLFPVTAPPLCEGGAPPLSPASPRQAEALPGLSGPPRGAVTPRPRGHVVYAGYTARAAPHLWGELWEGGPDGGYYCGGFRHGARHGYGRQVMASGERYEGRFRRNAWSGGGNYFADDGAVLQGVFRRGRLRRLCYHGEVDDRRLPHGRGVGYAADGAIYNGEWCHGERRGTGVLQDLDGRIYSGEFRNGHMNGRGKLIKGSNVYYGDFVDSLKHGKGIEFSEFCAIEGEWVRGLSNGHCKIWDNITHELYEANYRNGKEQDDCFLSPIKVENRLALDCSNCKKRFSLFLRRHHCRLCGDIFCDSCTQTRATLPDHLAKSPKAGGEVNRAYLDDQRVCEACALRLRQRRMVAIKRYGDQSVYAGLWSQGHWVSRGLYCHPNGLFIVMDKHGKPILSKRKPSKVERADSKGDNNEGSWEVSDLKGGLSTPNPRLTSTGEGIQDASPPKEVLNALTESSPREELELFSKWWAQISEECKLTIPLEVPPIQTRMGRPHEPSHGSAKENLAEGGGTLGIPRTEVENSPRCFPKPPVTPSPRLFVCLQDAYYEPKSPSGQGPPEAAKGETDEQATIRKSALPYHEPYEYEDENVHSAVLRAARFVPEVIPRPPPLPLRRGASSVVPQKTLCKSCIPAEAPDATGLLALSEADDEDTMERADSNPYAPFLPLPPRLEDSDRSDRAVLLKIVEERQRKAGPFGLASKQLISRTPPPPPYATNVEIPWADWEAREVPFYKGGTVKAEGPPVPVPSDALAYVACPFWRPVPTDTQAALVAGKMTRAVELMLEKGTPPAEGEREKGRGPCASGALSSLSSDEYSAGSSDGSWVPQAHQEGGTSHGASKGSQNRRQQRPKPLTKEPLGESEGSGVGWLPAPLTGPFKFHIRTLPIPTSGDRTSKNVMRVKVSMTPYSLRNGA